jgi:hypothetical protein
MFKNFLIGFIWSIALLANCQTPDHDKRIYSFLIDNILSNSEGKIIISKVGSSSLLLNSKDSLNLDPTCCFFIDENYRKTEFWNSILTGSDLEYIYEQISYLKNFKWEAEKLPENIVIYSKSQIRNYCKKALKGDKQHKEEAINKRKYTIKSINTFSVPVFNKSGNLALIYSSEYSGPESASWEIRIYFKIEENWVLIGSYLLGIT